MTGSTPSTRTDNLAQLRAENEALREEMEEARETIRALRNGEVDALVIAGANGAEILTLQGSEKLAASVFEQGTEAILVCDSTGQIIRASKAAHDLCGHNPLLQHFDSVFRLVAAHGPGELNTLHSTNFARLCHATREIPVRGFEVQFDCKNESHHLLLSASPWVGVSEEFLGCVITLTDITVLKNAELSLAKAADDAQGQSKAREDFIAILAHELRNPLAPIRNAIAALRLRKNQDPALSRPFDIIDRQVLKMLRMIDDLLDISRLQRGKLALSRQAASLNSIVNNALETCGHLVDRNQRQLAVSLPSEDIVINADPVRLEQVVSNIVGNAVKFTNPGGHISINAECTENAVVLRIKDDGIGISPEMLPKIFSMFSQEEHAKSKGGLGIGLALVSQIVKLHGGEIEAMSEGVGKGSEFVLTLPFSPLSPVPSSGAIGTTTQPSHRVLVIEDHADNCETLCMLLTMWGHKVESAQNGRRGIELALASKPEFAIVDLNLPDMEGYEVARRIRAELKNKVRLIALTGYGRPEDMERSSAAGFDMHLVKPADAAKLIEIFCE
jgi:signal transduction histidine kinase/CheY-like chemotaxis protein